MNPHFSDPSRWIHPVFEAIFTLARRGDLNAVKRALDLDADPNIPDTLGILEAEVMDLGLGRRNKGFNSRP